MVDSVALCVRIGRLCKPRTRAPDIVHHIEPFQERHSVDEVQSLAAVRAEVIHNEVDLITFTADVFVQLWVQRQ